jgi:serine protease Do
MDFKVKSWVKLTTAILLTLSSHPLEAQWQYLKNHPQVRRAFNPTIEQARQSTVRLHADGQPVALGAIVDRAGLIVSKSSELHGALSCQLADGKKYPARILVRDVDYDLALLCLEGDPPEKLVTVDWRSSRPPGVGSWLATTDLTAQPLAVGIVSVAARKIPHQRGFLGVRLGQDEQGPKIVDVIPKGAADTAGLRGGDIVTQIDGRRVENRRELVRRIAAMHPGQIVTLRIVRGPDREPQDLTARLGTPELVEPWANRFSTMNAMGGFLSVRRADFPSALEHDTVLKRNQCGGPLVDTDGKVVGINIARAGRTSSYAVPAKAVLELIKSWQGAPEHQIFFQDPKPLP